MVYLIGGAPRTGKSIIAHRLMSELTVPWISTDVLRAMVHDLTPEGERLRKFPFKGFDSNDELSALAILEMVRYQVVEAQSLELCLGSLVRHQIAVRDDQIIEGVHLLPEHVKKMMEEPANAEQIKALFIISTDESLQLEAMRNNSSHFDWLSGASDKTYESVAGFVVAYGKWIQEECEKYQLPYFVRRGHFEEENAEILKKLMV